jgi:hypothetical protein
MDLYVVEMDDGTVWHFRANLSEASAPLCLVEDDPPFDSISTQYQTADARHRAEDAAALLWPLEANEATNDDWPAIRRVVPVDVGTAPRR